MFEPIPGYDDWKTTPPAERELGRDIQPDDVCKCGCEYRHHHGHDEACWKCAEQDEVCRGFALDWVRLEKDAEALAI